jgi:hypothetical protein
MSSSVRLLNRLSPMIIVSGVYKSVITTLILAVIVRQTEVKSIMSRGRRLTLVIPGTALIVLSFMLIASGGTKADSVSGTWTSTVAGHGYFDHTWPADFYYDGRLSIDGGSGSFKLTCTNVVINQPGWEAALQGIGMITNVGVEYTVLGSSVTLMVHGTDGRTYTYALTVNGGRMTGSGQYTDSSGTVNSWTLDLTRSGGGTSVGALPNLAGPAAAASIGGFLAGFAVSLLPPPRYMGGSIMPPSKTTLGTPYAPSQSIGSFRDQIGGVTRPLPDVPRMRMPLDPIQFPNIQMGTPTEIRPTDIHPTDTLSKRFCQYCGSPLMVTAGGWSCPGCNRAPPGGLDP